MKTDKETFTFFLKWKVSYGRILKRNLSEIQFEAQFQFSYWIQTAVSVVQA